MLDNNLFEILAKTAVFSNLDETTVMKILASVHYQIRAYDKDDFIALKGDTCNWLQIVVEGSVRGEMLDSMGKALNIENIKQTEVIAIAFLFGRNSRFPVNVVSNTQSKIFRISKHDIFKIMQEHTQVLENILVLVSEKAQFLTGRIQFLSLKTIKEKIASYLISKKPTDSLTVELDKSQSNLAVFFGVTRPALSRALKQMEDEGLIKVKNKFIDIIDINLLKKVYR